MESIENANLPRQTINGTPTAVPVVATPIVSSSNGSAVENEARNHYSHPQHSHTHEADSTYEYPVHADKTPILTGGGAHPHAHPQAHPHPNIHSHPHLHSHPGHAPFSHEQSYQPHDHNGTVTDTINLSGDNNVGNALGQNQTQNLNQLQVPSTQQLKIAPVPIPTSQTGPGASSTKLTDKSATDKVHKRSLDQTTTSVFYRRYLTVLNKLRNARLTKRRATTSAPSNTDENDTGTEDALSVEPTLLHKCIAEAFGTGVIVLTGVGSVNAAVFTGAQTGVWQVAVVWGFGVTLAILTTAAVSGAHLNPAVTLALAILRPESFEWSKVIYYWLAQLLGAFIAAFVNYSLYFSVINEFESKNGFKRGEPESILSAQAFGEYFPNPGFGNLEGTISPAQSFYVEAFGTGFLMLVILSVTDDRNTALKNKELAPYFIGFTVSVLISLYAPLNQAGFNPARDFGPRFAAFCLGWGDVAIPGPSNGFWTYIVGPLVGAPIGGAIYDFVLRPPP